VFTKKARHGLGFTPTVKVSQPAIKNPYNQPVYLLISGESASATEIMVLSSLSMPNITKIGSTTEGVFSDILDKQLPNGWGIGLSNEVYLDMNNNNFEGKGIKADINIPYPRDTQEFLHKLMSDLKEDDLAILGALKNLNTN
jgi:C-terminal processing protease CtpA/Prc